MVRRKSVTRRPRRAPKPERTSRDLWQEFGDALARGCGVIADDPERALRLAEDAVTVAKNATQFAQENSAEVKRFLRNTVISGVARSVKKRLERG